MNWAEFLLAFAAFFLTHAIPVRPPVRPWLVGHLGVRGFTFAYSALSLGVLAWLISAAGRAPYVALWQYEPWQNHVPLMAMLPVCLLVALAMARPNPFSFGGANNDDFNPERAGLVRWMRHPLLVALALWALSHVVPNGDLAHVLLFGVFAIFAFIGQLLVDKRMKRQMGARWQTLQQAVALTPLLSFPFERAEFILRCAAGVVLYAVLISVHPVLFGVGPLP